ncbi:MAG: hypothetical protein IKB88_02120 [Clostridia bacterium]|nr:hypothetical protein [Clostridia bacterium]
MFEVIITAKLLDSAEPDIIGIKEALATVIEKWTDCISIYVKSSAPLQMTFEDKPQIREKITVGAAIDYLNKNKLTIEEQQNIIQAIIKNNKIEATAEGSKEILN